MRALRSWLWRLDYFVFSRNIISALTGWILFVGPVFAGTEIQGSVPQGKSLTRLVSASGTVQAGSNVVLTAAVLPRAAGQALPSGLVVFSCQGKTIGVAQLSGDVLPVNVNFNSPVGGTFSCSALYSGDANTGGSASNVLKIDVTPGSGPSSTWITVLPAAVSAGQSVTVESTVGGNSPDGLVSVFLDGKEVGQTSLNGGSAKYTLIGVPAGRHTVSAKYFGDIANAASASRVDIIQVGSSVLGAPPSSPVPVVGYEYDATGNMTRTIEVPGVTDFGFSATNTYDRLDRLQATLNAKQGKTVIGYAGFDAPVSVTDPRGLVTSSPRNGYGDVTQLVSPDTGTTSNLTYDAAGNLKTRTDSRGVLTTYNYDLLSRLTGTVHGMGGNTQSFGYTYDQTGVGFSYGMGRLTSVTFPAGSGRLTYDPLGRVASYTQTVNAATGANATAVSAAVGYAYDGAGNPISIVYPSGRKLVLTYASGKLRSLALAATAAGVPQALISELQWEPFGPPSRWLWNMNSGVQLDERSFDTSGRMVRYRLGNLVRDVRYDEANRIRAFTHYDANSGAAQAGMDQGIDYDELGRVKSATVGTTTWSFGYDANGNRTSSVLNGSVSVYTPSSTSNRLNSITNPSRNFTQYDAAGNLISETQYAQTVDLAGRVATLTKAGVTSTYAYDSFGRRVRKFSTTGAASTIIFLHDAQGRLLGEYSSTGAALREYVWIGNMPVAMFTPDPANAANPPVVYFLHTDHLNTPRVAIDRAGNMRWRWLAEPFGTSAPETSPSGLAALNIPLRMPGQYADSESGLFYNYFRTYDPSIGRYTQSDPIGLAGGINTYAYVEGNPLSWTDPSGLGPVGEAIGGAIGGWGGRVLGGGIGAATPIPGGTVLGSIAGGALGKRAGGAIGSAIGDMCSPGDPDPCKQLNDDVQQAKDRVGRFSPAACSAGMSRWELQQRHDAWLDLASARAKRDQKCWAGGDAGHQQAQAAAWSHVGQCARLLK